MVRSFLAALSKISYNPSFLLKFFLIHQYVLYIMLMYLIYYLLFTIYILTYYYILPQNISPMRTGVPVLCLGHHCILNAYNST